MEAGGGGASSPYLLEPIDMARLLGPLGLLQGASTQQQHCFPPWKESVPDAALVGPMVDKLKQQLADALAPVATQATEAAPLRLTPLVQLAGSPHVDDPRWRQLDRLVTRVLARFALHATQRWRRTPGLDPGISLLALPSPAPLCPSQRRRPAWPPCALPCAHPAPRAASTQGWRR